MIGVLLLGIASPASAGSNSTDDAEGCDLVVTFGQRSEVSSVKVRRCPAELQSDLAYRAKQVPWRLILPDALHFFGLSNQTEDWTAVVSVAVPRDAPSNPLPTHDGVPPAHPDSVPLSDRFTAPSPDRRIELLSAYLVPPPDGLALLADAAMAASGPNPYIVQDKGVSLYNRAAALRRHKRGKPMGLTACTPWLVFDAAGKPTDLATHPPNACPGLPGVFIEPMLWRWTPPRWDSKPFGVGVPLTHVGIGRFQIAEQERFAPFLAGDILVSDVPFVIDLPPGPRPQLTRELTMEIPMILPELLESRLGIDDASRLACGVHLWAAPNRPKAYGLAVRGCPAFFANVVLEAYLAADVVPPEKPTHHVETVVFAFDEAAETWVVSRE